MQEYVENENDANRKVGRIPRFQLVPPLIYVLYMSYVYLKTLAYTCYYVLCIEFYLFIIMNDKKLLSI